MTRLAAILGAAAVLSSCAIYEGGIFGRREVIRQPAVINVPESYTKAEIDAINAHRDCLALARNQLQASRCGVRR